MNESLAAPDDADDPEGRERTETAALRIPGSADLELQVRREWTRELRHRAATAAGLEPMTAESALRRLMGDESSEGSEPREYFTSRARRLTSDARRQLWHDRALLSASPAETTGHAFETHFEQAYAAAGAQELWHWLGRADPPVPGCFALALKTSAAPDLEPGVQHRWQVLGSMLGVPDAAALAGKLGALAEEPVGREARAGKDLIPVRAVLLVARLSGMPSDLTDLMEQIFALEREALLEALEALSESGSQADPKSLDVRLEPLDREGVGEVWRLSVREMVLCFRQGLLPGKGLTRRKLAGARRRARRGPDLRVRATTQEELERREAAEQSPLNPWGLDEALRALLRRSLAGELGVLSVLAAGSPRHLLPPGVFAAAMPPTASVLAAARQYVLLDAELRDWLVTQQAHKDWSRGLHQCMRDVDPTRWGSAVARRDREGAAVAHVVWLAASGAVLDDLPVGARRVAQSIAVGAAALYLAELPRLVDRVVHGLKGTAGPGTMTRLGGVAESARGYCDWLAEETPSDLGMPPGHTRLDALVALRRERLIANPLTSLELVLDKADKLRAVTPKPLDQQFEAARSLLHQLCESTRDTALSESAG